MLFKNRYFILFTLFGICTLFYYFGELAKELGWVSLQWDFLYQVHDVHRLLFLAPIIYTAFYFGARLVLLVSAASFIVFLPRAIFISTFPDPIERAIIFVLVETGVGLLIAAITHRKLHNMGSTIQLQSAAVLPGITAGKISSAEFAIKELEFNLSAGLVKRQGKVIKLTRTEYKLLAFLVNNRGKVLSHQEILRNVWGEEYGNESEYLRTFISQLRRKIEGNPSAPKFIITEQGIGYRFAETE
jgi:DNA-binding winged helix-turn-helix (wHTH) protein